MVTVSVPLNFVCMITSITVICSASYILYSLVDLIKYHHYLLETGSLTKEDAGGNNFSITGPYSLGSVRANFKLAF